MVYVCADCVRGAKRYCIKQIHLWNENLDFVFSRSRKTEIFRYFVSIIASRHPFLLLLVCNMCLWQKYLKCPLEKLHVGSLRLAWGDLCLRIMILFMHSIWCVGRERFSVRRLFSTNPSWRTWFKNLFQQLLDFEKNPPALSSNTTKLSTWRHQIGTPQVNRFPLVHMRSFSPGEDMYIIHRALNNVTVSSWRDNGATC